MEQSTKKKKNNKKKNGEITKKIYKNTEMNNFKENDN